MMCPIPPSHTSSMRLLMRRPRQALDSPTPMSLPLLRLLGERVLYPDVILEAKAGVDDVYTTTVSQAYHLDPAVPTQPMPCSEFSQLLLRNRLTAQTIKRAFALRALCLHPPVRQHPHGVSVLSNFLHPP